MRSLRLPTLLAAATLAGCALEPFPSPCSSGACQPRPFTLPAVGDGIGPPGARRVDVAIDGHGRAVSAWEVTTMERSWIVIGEEEAPGVFSTLAPSAALDGNSTQPSIAAGQGGEVLLAFRQAIGSDGRIFVASARDREAGWVFPGPTDSFSFPPNAYEPRVAIGATGEELVVWNQWYNNVNFGVLVATRPSPGGSWTLPASADKVLSPPVFYSNAPRIALNTVGQALIVWYQSNGGPLMVYKSERSGPGAAFTRPLAADFLSAPGAPVDSHIIANPMPALAASGEAAVVWTQEDGKGAVPVFLATRDAAGTWTRPRDLGDTLSRPVGTARCPQVAFGPRGDLYVIWYQDEGSGDVVYAARRTADRRWITPLGAPERLSSDGVVGFAPSLAVGAGGMVLAVWNEMDHGVTRVAARRISEGMEGWGTIEILSPEGVDAVDPKAAIGGPGDRAVVGWAQGSFTGARAAFARVE